MRQNPQTENKNVRHIQLKVPADVYRKFHTACAHEETNMRAKALDLILEYTEKSTSFFDMEDWSRTESSLVPRPKQSRKCTLLVFLLPMGMTRESLCCIPTAEKNT